MFMATEILPGLWISSSSIIQATDWLTQNMIQCVINCSTNLPFPQVSELKVKYRWSINELETLNNLSFWAQQLEELADLIDQQISHYNILIYCTTGQQLAPTVILTYLLKYGHMDLNQAMQAIKSKKTDAFEPQFVLEAVIHSITQNSSVVDNY